MTESDVAEAGQAGQSPPSLRRARGKGAPEPHGHHGSGPGLVVAALGIVFGDIGTSPLYALHECINRDHGVDPVRGNVLGVLSLIVWSLTLVVTIKYLTFVMRADNGGEGGTLALLALVPKKLKPGEQSAGKIGWITLLVLAGTGLLYGDGMITPSISVLSAVEGVETIAPNMTRYVVPITCVILLGLFILQRRGTAGIGRFFGPIMVVWFVTIGGLGAWHLWQNPAVLMAINPSHAVTFFIKHKFHGFEVLGGVVLAVTGGEALYADMGHFGRGPIRIAWLGLVFPALLLCYFGMGALVLADPVGAADNPFFSLVPKGPVTYALVALSTAATVIASQALISGAFSVTQQAVQLGFFPRVYIRHTSKEMMGQIYVPSINWLLAIVCVILVVSFKESARLAAAYGIAVTGAMAITSIVYFVVIHETWKWPLWKSVPLLVFFLIFDLAFVGANALKIVDGGWVPLVIAAFFFAMMVIWKRGRAMLAALNMERSKPIAELVKETSPGGSIQLYSRPKGTGVFLSTMEDLAPPTLVRHAERVRTLNEHVLIVTIRTAHKPFVPREERTEWEDLGNGFHRVVLTTGFMQAPDVPVLLKEAKDKGLSCTLDDATYFLGRETILGLPGGRMGEVEETIFGFLSRNARHAGQYFGLPPAQVIEIGTQVDL